MRTTKYKTQIDTLAKRPLFNAEEARGMGVPARMLAHFCQQGIIERVGRGIYRGVEADTGLDLAIEELVMTAASIPHGVVCLISALCFYEMTDQMMREYWIAVPNEDTSPKRPHTRIVRMRNITLGATKAAVGEYQMSIFDRERSVIDAFRFLSHEIAIKALQAYLKTSENHKPDLQKLGQYAKVLRVDITPYIMALTT